MGRYTGPVCKICRREAMKLFLKGARCLGPRCGIDSRPYPPGEHGQARKKVSDYGQQLREKQKVRRYYSVYERPFRRYFREAARRRGITGEAMLQRLETRLDNVIFRAGLLPSRAQARQLISHRHIAVDGRVVNVPSFQMMPGMVIEVREKSRALEVFQQVATVRKAPAWMSVDADAKRIEIVSLPARDEMGLPEMHEQLIVEYYSR